MVQVCAGCRLVVYSRRSIFAVPSAVGLLNARFLLSVYLLGQCHANACTFKTL